MKYNTNILSGTTELLPAQQTQFDYLYSNLTQVFWQSGYQHIVTPILNRTDTLLAKAGGETEQQIYRVFKTGEEPSHSKQALRFDHTVPLARYVVEHNNDLVFPFKVCQIDRNFRGERAQHGRLREFYQCDIDVIGRQKLSISYDVDVIDTLSRALKAILTAKCTVQISNRKLLKGMLQELNLNQYTTEISHIIDRSAKVPAEKTQADFVKLKLSEDSVVKITTFTQIHGQRAEVIKRLQAFEFEDQIFNEGIAELDTILEQLEALFAKDSQIQIVADMAIVRGLDYYTGTIFETIVTEHPEYGSVCGGGRYENLAGFYTNQTFPGVGGSIGLSRLFATLDSRYFVQPNSTHPVDIVIAPITEQEFATANQLATQLRTQGLSIDVIFAGKKLADRLKYATKIAPAGIVIGSDEATTGAFKVKIFATGDEISLEQYLKD